MLKSYYASLLTSMGLSANTWIRPTTLNYIILENDGNQYFNPKMQKIYFDTTNGLIKVKYSKLVPITSVLKKFTYSVTNNSISFSLGYESIYYGKKLREPKAGDSVYCYDPQLKTYTYSTIASITSDYYRNVTFTLSDNTLIDKIKSTNYGLIYFLWLQEYSSGIQLENPMEYYTEYNETSFVADIYISIDNVTGFEFDKSWMY